MKKEMRRSDRQLTQEEVIAILENGRYGILSTTCDDGYPYGVPMSYAYADGKIYFHHTNEESLLGSNISDSTEDTGGAGAAGGGTKACFTVVGGTELLSAKFSTVYESAVAFGTIRRMEDKVAGLMQIVSHLSPDYMEAGRKYAESSASKVDVYEFTIEQITGKARKNR